jgi:RNA polymerase sigma-70 factor (ECF subfamily)
MLQTDPTAAAEDLALLTRAQQGDASAAKLLFRRLAPRAHALAWRMLGDAAQAEDVVQDALIKLLEVRQFKGQARLSTYFHTMVSRACLTLCRSRQPVQFDSELADDHADDLQVSGPEVALAQGQQADWIQAGLLALPPRQRLAISLWAYHDLSAADIAQVLQVDRNAADQLLHRAKTNLKKRWEHDHERV